MIVIKIFFKKPVVEFLLFSVHSGTNRLSYTDAVLRLPTERRALNERREKPVGDGRRGAGLTPFSGNPLFKKLPTSPCRRECALG